MEMRRRAQVKIGLPVATFMTGAFMLMFSGSGTQASTDRSPKIKVSTQLMEKSLKVIAKAPAGHHFNLKAPYSLSEEGSTRPISPTRIDEHEIQYKISNPPKTRFYLGLYLCDDAKTFCEKRMAWISWNEEMSQFLVQTENERDSKKTSSTPQSFVKSPE